ncbi:MAG TPA: TetR/AcrR family transcriptional regulator [Desulfobacter sp.]|nr:TetR/AcrR family transcriptional regulator [Desulfobacter sp.]
MKLKEKIIVEALRQFSTKGFMATSTADIINVVGTSKGGLYNHFKNKEQLFLEVLRQARKIWRERNLAGLETIERPVDKIKHILVNYKDNYLADSTNFPGGCIFINLTVELSDQCPHLAAEVSEGFGRFKFMLRRFLEQERLAGMLKDNVEIDGVVAVVFSGLLGACVMYTADKSKSNLDQAMGALAAYIDNQCISY